MKKSTKYIQASILNDTMKFCKLEDVAKNMIDHLDSGDDPIELYDVRDNSIVIRTKHTGELTDNKIAKALAKAVVDLIEESNDIIDYINDNSSFSYSSSYLTDDFFESIIDVIKTGRLVSIDIDFQ